MVFTIDGLNALDNTPRTNTELAKGYNGLEEDFPLSFITPQRTCRYFKDFLEESEILNAFVETSTAGDVALVSTSQNGVMILTCNNDLTQIQQANAPGVEIKPWKLQTGLPVSFFTRLDWNNTSMDMVTGLIVEDTDVITSVTDGVFFRLTNANVLEFVSVQGSSETTLEIDAVAGEDKFVGLGFVYDGAGNIKVYRSNEDSTFFGLPGETTTDGKWNLVGTVSTNIPDSNTTTTALTYTAAVFGTSVEQVFIDYIDIQSTRP